MVQAGLSIKLRCTSWQQLATIYKRDLSKGTMFLKAATPPAIGTSVRIDLTLPSASVIVLTGVVEHHVNDPQRGVGVELKLAPIPTGSIWLIESALSSENRRTPPTSVSVPVAPQASGPIASINEGAELATAEADLIRALMAEAESLKKLNPFLVLGVGYEANDTDVRGAFGELTKRYHPDRFARYQSVELRQVAAEIFILIRDAYRRLGDDQSRAQVLASLGRSKSAVPIPRSAGAPGLRADGRRIPTAQIPVLPSVPRPLSDPKSGGIVRPISDVKSGPVKREAPVPAIPPLQPAPRPAAPPAATAIADAADSSALEELLDNGRLDEALGGYKALAKRHPQDRTLRAGVELCEGLLALNLRDRLEAAQRFETALEIDPSNERAARELADMRRQATNERKGLLSRLMGKRDD